MQRFRRLQLHGPTGRQPRAQRNDQPHQQQYPTKTDSKTPPGERKILQIGNFHVYHIEHNKQHQRSYGGQQ